LNGTVIGKIIENASVFNAFYSCTYGNLRNIVGVYAAYKYDLFAHFSVSQMVDYLNGVVIGATYDAEHCVIASKIVNNAFKKYVANQN